MASEISAAWLLTVALHASALIGVAWLVDRGALRSRPAWREMLWRAAFYGGVVTASLQTLLGAPLPTRITLPTKMLHDAAVASTLPAVVEMKSAPVQRSENSEPAHRDASRVASTASAPVGASSRWTKAFTLPPWHLILIAGWLAGTLLALARLAIGWIRLERSLAQTEPVTSSQLLTDAAALAIEAEIDTPRLAMLDDLSSPIAARGPRIVLPRWSVELLDREPLRAMLAHETAHIARRDPAWKLAGALWSALFWFVPLARLARRRLDEIAEVSCDAWAAIHLGDGRSLAECLAECAEHRVGAFDPDLAPAMASRESPLLQRIDYLIAGAPMNIQSAGARAGFAAAVAMTVAAFVLPGVSLSAASPPAPPAPPAAPAAPAASSGHHVHISSDTDKDGTHDMTIVQVNDDKQKYSVKVEGKIAFNDGEDDVASLSKGGSAAFAETRGNTTQRIEIANRGGKLERRYFVDDVEKPYDATAQQWMATLVPKVIRETALDAEGRVARIRAKGGADAVIDEIGRIDSGYARGVYIRYLAASGKLTAAQMTRALKLVDAVDSDYEKRNALVALVSLQPLDAEQQKLVLAQADRIGSAYERAELLVTVLPQLSPEPDVRKAWLKAAEGIDGDYEHARTLKALLDAGHADDATITAVVREASKVGSDYERRTLLTAAIQSSRDADTVATEYAAAAHEIGSDYERREALVALIRAPGFGKAGAGAVLDALSGIGSDYDCREVLVALARVMPNDASLIEKYRGIARHLSDYERGEAERALDRFAAT